MNKKKKKNNSHSDMAHQYINSRTQQQAQKKWIFKTFNNPQQNHFDFESENYMFCQKISKETAKEIFNFYKQKS